MNARSQRTRKQLIDAGLKLFSRHPVDAVSIDEIVEIAEVGKGSFFNHFKDKQSFAKEIATIIREEIESDITLANDGVTDPLRRLVGGMVVAVNFVLCNPASMVVVLRQSPLATGRDHPLNAGLRHDIDLAVSQGLLRSEASHSGLLLWASAVSSMVLNIVDRQLSRKKASIRMQEIMMMALIGLGVDEASALELSQESAEGLRKMRTVSVMG